MNRSQTKKMLLACVCTFAIENSVAAEETSFQLDEIVVTAQKKSESLQSVPLAISAFGGDDLRSSGINNTQDLQLYTPGLIVSNNAVWGLPYIRGIGNEILSIGSDPSVAVHVDGVYLSRPLAALQELYDVERVEVIKGPQGTLYGRNATGGAINVITNQPTEELSASASASYGNYNALAFKASVGGAIVADKVMGRISFLKKDRDGYTKNLFNGETVEDEDLFAGRASLKFVMSEDVSLTVSGDWATERDTRGTGVKALSDGPAAMFFGGQTPADSREVFLDAPLAADTDQYGINAKLKWDLKDVTFTSITGYRKSEIDVALDIDGTDISFIYDTFEENSKTLSQEFNLSSNNDGPLEWIFGLYYLNEKADSFIDIYIPEPAPGANPQFRADNTTNAYAVFGQASYALTDKFSLTAGLRYSHEEKHFVYDFLFFGAPLAHQDETKEWNSVTPKFSMEYAVDEDTLLYASVTKGFKSGGFNNVGSPQSPFEPEKIWSYEAGVKTTMLENRLRINMAGFYYDYTDLQVNRFQDGVAFILNAGAATVKGLELELQAYPTDNLSINVAASVLDAEFDDFITENPSTPLAGLVNLAGNVMPRSPDFTVSIVAKYMVPLGESGNLSFQGEYQYQGQMYFDQFNASNVQQDSFGLWNARVNWQDANDNWTVSAYMKNIGDTEYRSNALSSGGTGTVLWLAPPQTYGLEVAYRY